MTDTVPVERVSDEAMAAYVAWEPPCEVDVTRPARALGLVRAAFFAGWKASRHTAPAASGELVEALKARLRDGDDARDGWTDAAELGELLAAWREAKRKGLRALTFGLMGKPKPTTSGEVSQRAREAAADMFEAQYARAGVESGRLQLPTEMRCGDRDYCAEVQAFARFEADTKAEVEVLREALEAVELARATDEPSDWIRATKLTDAALNYRRQAK